MEKELSDRRIRKTIAENRSTPTSILLSSEFGLLRLGDITKNDAERITADAAKKILRSPFTTGGEMLARERRKLSSGCQILDNFLGGGFPTGGIAEIAGESGSGKTQLCLQLLLTTQYPEEYGGLNAGAVYISTEASFPSQRLQQLIQTFPKLGCVKLPCFGDNIYIEHIAEADQLEQCLKEKLPNLISMRKIGLIVIDSTAGVFRSSYDLQNCQKRAEGLRSVGDQLHFLAHAHNICVISVNQVTANINSTACHSSTVPSLGLAWANMVTTRLQMYRTDPACNVVVRRLDVLFSPYLPIKSINFSVSEEGVKGIFS